MVVMSKGDDSNGDYYISVVDAGGFHFLFVALTSGAYGTDVRARKPATSG